jgi:hypothetical protein
MAGAGDEQYDSILLKQQMALLRVLDPTIKLTLSSDGHKLIASNISETKANEIRLITNNDIYYLIYLIKNKIEYNMQYI